MTPTERPEAAEEMDVRWVIVEALASHRMHENWSHF